MRKRPFSRRHVLPPFARAHVPLGAKLSCLVSGRMRKFRTPRPLLLVLAPPPPLPLGPNRPRARPQLAAPPPESSDAWAAAVASAAAEVRWAAVEALVPAATAGDAEACAGGVGCDGPMPLDCVKCRRKILHTFEQPVPSPAPTRAPQAPPALSTHCPQNAPSNPHQTCADVAITLDRLRPRPSLGQSSTTIGWYQPELADFGQICADVQPKSDRLRPIGVRRKWGRHWRNLANFGKTCTNIDEQWTDVDQIWGEVGHIWQSSVKFGPTLIKLGLGSIEIERRLSAAQTQKRSAQVRAEKQSP